jgi:hypothetical protein
MGTVTCCRSGVAWRMSSATNAAGRFVDPQGRRLGVGVVLPFARQLGEDSGVL